MTNKPAFSDKTREWGKKMMTAAIIIASLSVVLGIFWSGGGKKQATVTAVRQSVVVGFGEAKTVDLRQGPVEVTLLFTEEGWMDFWGDDRPGNWVKITPENHKGPALLVRAGEYLPLPRAKGMYRFKVEGNCQITFWLHRLDDNVPPGGVPTSPTPRTPLPQPKLASHI